MPAAALAGSYSGTYQGDAKGPVTMTITGQAIDVVVTVGGKNYAASGAVASSGGVSVGIGTGDGVTVTVRRHVRFGRRLGDLELVDRHTRDVVRHQVSHGCSVPGSLPLQTPPSPNVTANLSCART